MREKKCGLFANKATTDQKNVQATHATKPERKRHLSVEIPMSFGGQDDALCAATGQDAANTGIAPVQQPRGHRDHLRSTVFFCRFVVVLTLLMELTGEGDDTDAKRVETTN